MQKTLYQILGLSSSATPEEIKKAYRRLAMQYHPDKNPSEDAEEMFLDIQEAYDTLSDPEDRAAYDQSLLYGTIHHDAHETNDEASYPEEAAIDPITGRRNSKYYRGAKNRKAAPKKSRIPDISEIPIYKAFYFTPRIIIAALACYVIVFFALPLALDLSQMLSITWDALTIFPAILFCIILFLDLLLPGSYRIAQVSGVNFCKEEYKGKTFYKQVVNYRICKKYNTKHEGYLHQGNSKTESIVYNTSGQNFEVGVKYIFYYTPLLGYNYEIRKSEKISTKFNIKERYMPLGICGGVLTAFGLYVHYHNAAAQSLGFIASLAILITIYRSAESS